MSSVSKQTAAQKAVSYLRGLQPAEVTVLANKLFPGNPSLHQRVLFYTYVRTLQNRVKRNVNPRIYVANFIGAPGYGKSAITYDFGFKMSDWVNETFTSVGEKPIQFQILVKTLGGINDFADITGLVYVKQDQGRTGLAVPETFPMDENSMGILFLDDFNRAHGHILAGVMEFVNTGR